MARSRVRPDADTGTQTLNDWLDARIADGTLFYEGTRDGIAVFRRVYHRDGDAAPDAEQRTPTAPDMELVDSRADGETR